MACKNLSANNSPVHVGSFDGRFTMVARTPEINTVKRKKKSDDKRDTDEIQVRK